jgi:phosphatidylglycerol---prolipoprotein diacylglyceryl transferase
MYPILIQFGKISLYTYGLFVALGFFVGMTLAQKEARRLGQDPNQIMDVGFFLLIAALVGARLFYVLVNPQPFLEDPFEVFRIWNGGLVYYGGFLGALLVAIIFVRKKQLSFWQMTDIFTPSLAIGHVLGRIGCFFAGCCYGKSCDLPWAVTFHNSESLAPIGIPLHPTQIYSAFANLFIFLLVWFFRGKKSYNGQLFWLYVLFYGVIRTIIETFRGDPRGQFFIESVSVSQFIGIGLAIISVFMLLFLRKWSRGLKG